MALHAQETESPTPTPQLSPTASVELPEAEPFADAFAVTLDNKTLFLIYNPIASFSPQERAEAITHRLEQIAQDRKIAVTELTIQSVDGNYTIFQGPKAIVTTTEMDAKVAKQSNWQLANDRLVAIQNAITEHREKRAASYLLRSLALAVGATVAMILGVRLIFYLSAKVVSTLAHWQRSSQIQPLRIGQAQVVAASQIVTLLLNFFYLLRLALMLFAGYLYLSTVFSLFPWTEQLGISMSESLRQGIEQRLANFVDYLPKLGALIIIFLVTWYIIRIAKFFFSELKQGTVSIPGFYREWADPTSNLIIVGILTIGVVTASPYLPGFGSPAFQGISVFVGLLAALGSTGTVANVVAGLILIYSRAFQVGDRVKISDVVGDVIENTLLATRLRTHLNVYVTIPNSIVLNNPIINYSTTITQHKTPLILETTITLGYDAPWRKVHTVLVEAARATENVLADPSPFVFQTSLNDFHISYTLHAYTNTPHAMAKIYAELHQNIQDHCNEANIEILSPAYTSIRDGNHTTIPQDYLAKDYQAPPFRLFPWRKLGNLKDP
jgi:small-conductance mechanosensitive channel